MFQVRVLAAERSSRVTPARDRRARSVMWRPRLRSMDRPARSERPGYGAEKRPTLGLSELRYSPGDARAGRGTIRAGRSRGGSVSAGPRKATPHKAAARVKPL